jgi:hypothetical protein
MFSRNRFISQILSLLAISAVGNLGVWAQDDNIDARISHQMRRINRGVEEGALNQKQARELKDTLNDIALQVERARKKGNGKLNENDITKFDNDLNQNSNSIQTQTGAGKKVKESGDALGPKWAEGSDGAQDPQKLRREMKAQNKRQMKQYDQAMQQVQEMQQQQYEKEMLNTLGGQRPAILKNKQELEKIREKTGAN